MGRTKKAVKARIKRRRAAKKTIYKQKQLASVPVDDIVTSVSVPTSIEFSHTDSLPSPETSELEDNYAPKECQVDKKLRVLKKLLDPREDPYYSSDPLAKAFCEWRVAKNSLRKTHS